MNSRAQIVATIGPSCVKSEILFAMIEHQMDVARLNFSWGTFDERVEQIKMVREAEQKFGRKIPIIADLPGPRVQETDGHTYNKETISALTEKDKEYIKFAVEHGIDYIALSFVGSKEDIKLCKEVIKSCGGKQPVIAKIERARAVQNIDEIIAATDAIMVARGDLGNEVPLEQIPFLQEQIVKKAKIAGKPVIVATQMMFSMTDHPTPSRAEVTDVENAILEGADAVMLSDETASGKYPVEAVTYMEKMVLEAEKHLGNKVKFNTL